MTELDKLLEMNQAPTADADLAARILAKSTQREALNDVYPQTDKNTATLWPKIAATIVIISGIGFGGVQNYLGQSHHPDTQIAEAQWEEAADSAGFKDIYEWTFGESG